MSDDSSNPIGFILIDTTFRNGMQNNRVIIVVVTYILYLFYNQSSILYRYEWYMCQCVELCFILFYSIIFLHISKLFHQFDTWNHTTCSPYYIFVTKDCKSCTKAFKQNATNF